ncbi:MAG: hypothetical protein WBL06_11050 [Pseudolysinimonas sp.]|uniref:hypothetical protein n=1 Tax=Pseudolysinimonas sp. TaxID=2680009 RepID=UPI003C72C9C0
MNPDSGEDAEDFFAKFEREAREAAQRRAAEEDAAGSPPAAALPPPPPHAAPVAPVWQPTTTYGPGTTYGPPPTQLPPTQVPPRPEPEATQAMPTYSDEPTQALVPAPLRPPADPEPGSALDSLFGDDAFREYEAGLGPDPSNSPFANRGRSKELVHVPGGEGPPPSRGFGTPQKILAGVGGGLLAVIALIALFLLGTRLPDLLGPAPAVVASPTPTPTPTRTPLAIGPVAPGTHEWNELLGGECLEPYDVETGAWAEEYTVVDCATPHGAQMVYRAWFPAEPTDPETPDAEPVWGAFPGAAALQAQISLLCSAPGVVDLAAAGAYNDVQMQGAYPVTDEQWESDPSYYCFVSRSSGEPLTTSVAIPRAPVEPAPSG